MKEVNDKMDILTTTYLNGIKSIEMLQKTNSLLAKFSKCTESINRAFEIENKLNSRLFQTSNYIETTIQTNANYDLVEFTKVLRYYYGLVLISEM